MSVIHTAGLTLIVAVADGGVIGRDGALPWRLPEDLRHFRRLTLGNTVLMGRKTWESLPRALDGRDNWVLTRDAGFAATGARVFHDLNMALATHCRGRLIVIGGAELYRQTLPLASRIELTQVHAAIEGDTHFPPIVPGQWRDVARERHRADERHDHAFSFVTLERLQDT